MGVTFDGDANGTFPPNDKDLPYLLPLSKENAEDPYTMNVIFHNEVWLRDQLWQLLNNISGLSNIKIERDQSKFYSRVTANLGFTVPGGRDVNNREYFWGWVHEWKWPELDFYGEFKIVHTDDVLAIEWAAETSKREHYIRFVVPGGIRPEDPDGVMSVRVRTEIRLKLMGEGDLQMVPGEVEVTHDKKFTGFREGFREKQAEEAFDDYVKSHIIQKVDEVVKSITVITSGIRPLNVLRLNSLLFRSDDVATPRLLATPGDLSLLGDLAPKLTTFAVEPLEETVSALPGNTVTFHLDPAIDGKVDWAVKGLPGEPGDAGSILNGVYTPPAAASLTERYKRVIVTATANGNSSSAMVTVVADTVAIYPFFQIAQYKTDSTNPRYVLTGGDIKGDLKWNMTSTSKGTVREAQAGDSDLDIPVDKNVRIYESPIRTPGDAGTVAALVHLDGVEVSAGGQMQVIDVVIPWTTTTAGLEATAQNGGGLKLTLYFDNAETGNREELTPAETLWEVLKGTGQLNRTTGIYTPGADEGPYVIVAGRENPPERLAIWNYAVIPLSRLESHQAFIEHVRTHSNQGRI